MDGRSDLFSLGSVMYFMATGREPFRGSQPLSILQKIASDQPLSANRVNSDVPKTLAKIIDRLLEKRPEDRIQSAQQLSDLLESLLAHLQQPQTMSLPRLPSSARRWREVSRFVLASVAIIGLLVGAAVLASQVRTNNSEVSTMVGDVQRPPSVADIIALHSEIRENENQAIAIQREITSLSRLIETTDRSWSSTSVQPQFPSLDPIASEADQIEREIRALERELF